MAGLQPQSAPTAPDYPKCKIELPIPGDDEKYGGTRHIQKVYNHNVDKQIGEGTYGQVFLGHKKDDDQVKVALKKIRMDTEKEGFPITAIREIKILKDLQHENVVNLRDIVRSDLHKKNNWKGSIYMAFDYSEYDLTGLMESVKYKFTEAQVKCIMKQLLKGLAYVHGNGVLHRDLKASNILIDKHGIVKLADFGLARTYQNKQDGRLTNRVITLWYRPPELLLGSEKYGPEIDMWSVGCILAELLVGKPIFPGNDEMDQLDKIFRTLGTPSEQTWPNFSKLPFHDKVPPSKYKGNNLKKWLKDMAQKANFGKDHVKDDAVSLLEKLLSLDPAKRITAVDAIRDSWFWTDPMPCDPISLPCRGTSHEFTMKRRRNEQEKERTQHQQPFPAHQQHPQQFHDRSGGGGRGGPAPGAHHGRHVPAGAGQQYGGTPSVGYHPTPDMEKRGRYGGTAPLPGPASVGGLQQHQQRGGAAVSRPPGSSNGSFLAPVASGYGRGGSMPPTQGALPSGGPGSYNGMGSRGGPPTSVPGGGHAPPHAMPLHPGQGHYGIQPQQQMGGYSQGNVAGAMPPPSGYPAAASSGQQVRPPAPGWGHQSKR